ncbi:MAG: PD40 domain-containing protein [Bacteroidaceae bacterium]|nr:PD40 domain-containing protein [Bacteroidaceae bacterium]
MKRIHLLFSVLLLASLFPLRAQEPATVTPLWLRDVKISPDGQQIAFCYKGDIWLVPTRGGSAHRLTSLDSYECNPLWSPDGKSIAFSSDRYGNFDIFVMPQTGGTATRLTYNSVSEIAQSFSADGASVLFSACIQDPAESAQFPSASLAELYSVPVKGGTTTQVLATPAEMVCFGPKGDYFLYQDKKGVEDEWRKHHTSSITRDIWRYDIKSGRHTNLTQRAGEDRNPVVSADGQTVYLLSEPAGGTLNVWSFPLSKPEAMTQVTHFATHPVRFLSQGAGTLCFTWNGEIYTLLSGAEPVKVPVTLTLDEENKPEKLTMTSGATSASVSPDGKQIAFVARGDVYVTSVEYATTKQITHTAAAERDVCFGHDNRSLVYTSERDGLLQLYTAKIHRKEDPNFPNATLTDEEPLLPDTQIERSSPKFSPDGKELAFIQDRTQLMVMNVETKSVRIVTDGSSWFSLGGGFDYSWSPDGKWFTLEYTPNGHDPYYDIGLVSAQGGEITNLTGSGYMCGSPRFVLDGNAILFESERYGMRAHASWGSEEDVFLCFLNQDAYDKYRLSKEDYELRKELEKKSESKETPAKDAKKDVKKSSNDKAKPEKKGKDAEEKESGEEKKENGAEKKEEKAIKVELEGIQDRVVRLTPNSSRLGDAIISKDGESLYYLSTFEAGMDLWKLELRKRETKLVAKAAGSGRFVTDGEGKTIFLLGSTMKKLEGDKLTPISWNAEMKLDHAAEREYMFNYVYREEQKRFYTETMHGVDWDGLTEAYRRFLPHINNNYDFAEMLSEWLGELNVSHTGGRYRPRLSSEATASLGLLYDLSYTGKGLKVAEVLKGGPFDHANLKLQKGDIVTHVNGTEITPEADISLLLAGQAGKKTLVSVKGKDDMVVLPQTIGQADALLYKRWVKNRAADVEKWSGGRLGYVHIEGMNDASFRTIYNDILGKYNKCDGIVIDTRYNGGGRAHEDIEILFSGEKYLTQVVRGRESCDMPSRRWNKPSIMLQCESNYSNAHGTPWVYSHQHLGKLVGAPVPGTMTSVNWVTLQDPTLIFGIPVVGYRTAEGTYLENSQLEPDIYVLNSPETLVKGEDTQLKVAVEALLKEIDGK